MAPDQDWLSVFLAEKITPSVIVGLLVIVIGSVLAARRVEPTPQ